jgi:hypothetical protein
MIWDVELALGSWLRLFVVMFMSTMKEEAVRPEAPGAVGLQLTWTPAIYPAAWISPNNVKLYPRPVASSISPIFLSL